MSGSARWQDVRLQLAGDKPSAKTVKKLRPAESGESIVMAEAAKTLDDNRVTFVNVSPKVDKPVWGAFELIEPIANDGGQRLQLEVVISAAYGTGPLLWRVAVTDAAVDLLVPEAIRAIVQSEPEKTQRGRCKTARRIPREQQPAAARTKRSNRRPDSADRGD